MAQRPGSYDGCHSTRAPASVTVKPLRIEADLGCSAERAFNAWTERFGQWWPPAHSVTGAPAAIVLEPWPGGANEGQFALLVGVNALVGA